MERYNASFDVRVITYQHDGGWDWLLKLGDCTRENRFRLFDSESEASVAANLTALDILDSDVRRRYQAHVLHTMPARAGRHDDITFLESPDPEV